MSRRGVVKLLRSLGLSAFIVLVAPAWSWAQQACSTGACFGTPCAVGCAPCQSLHCPPAYQHCYEGGPRIHWKCGCPHPICNPCDLPHWGYYDKCWTPWPFPPNWTHCPTLPPAATVVLNPMVHPSMPAQPSYQPRLPTQPGQQPRMPLSPQGVAPMFPNGNDTELPLPQRFDPARPPF